jgi:hypothetical protein
LDIHISEGVSNPARPHIHKDLLLSDLPSPS